jgi:hypothetical protein
VGDGRLERILAWIASVVAVGLLGAGVYAVFHSTNGSGTFALLTIGPLALFVIVFRERIRSLEFGGAKIQLALRVKNSVGRAFKLRLLGNYEQAETEIELAFDQFVTRERHKIRQEYYDSKEYQQKVLTALGQYVQDKFNGQVLDASSTVSFLPLIDAVMTVDGDRLKAELKSHDQALCEYLTERLENDKTLRAAVIVRPGPDLDTMKLVERLEREVRHGALSIDCFLLVQNCKDSPSRKQFCELINQRGMHAKSLAWEPARGSEKLKSAFLQAILTICDPSQCGFSKAASLTRLNSASQAPAILN